MTTPAPEKTQDAIDLLKADHRDVDQLFSQYRQAKGRSQRRKLVEKIAAALTAHTILEEEIFYPACSEKGVDEADLDEAQVEHDTLKLLIADLLTGAPHHDYYDAKVTVLSEYVKHHVGEEEHPSDGIFARAKSAGLDMAALGAELQARKEELTSNEARLLARPPEIRSLDLSPLSRDYGDRARYPIDRYRGDYDEDYGPNRGAYGRSDYDRPARGYPDDWRAGPGRSGYRRIEQSASGGRYRLEYGRGEDDRNRPSAGRYLGPGGEDREYYQGTRYGSDYGGGRYRTEDENESYWNREREDDRERYRSGQGRGNR